jgi:hypothetical protein
MVRGVLLGQATPACEIADCVASPGADGHDPPLAIEDD